MNVDAAFDLVRHAFASDRLAHAYLVVGAPRGAAGELATRMLQLLFCSGKTAPCGACDRCRQVRERKWADAFWLRPEKKSRMIGVDAMRDSFLHNLTQTSLAGGWKAGVVVDADRLGVSAANAFLKFLEEPPPRTLLLLLTEAPQILLPTIVSRCHRLEVPEPPVLSEPWNGRLLALLTAPPAAGPLPAMVVAAELAALLEELKTAAEQEVKAEAAADAAVEEDADVVEARISARYRELRSGVVRGLLDWYRDLLVLRAGAPAELLQHPAHGALLQERAAQLSLGQALANVLGVEELNRQLERNVPEGSLLAYWLDRLAPGGTPSAARAAG